MSFENQLNSVRKFFHMSYVRFNLANTYIKELQRRYPASSDDKDFYVGELPPSENPPNYDFKVKIGDFSNSIEPHISTLINNCLVLLTSFWEDYSKQNNLKKYYNEYITEVFLYRNCIVHNSCVIGEEYIKKSKLQKYKLGDKLNLSREDFKTILNYFSNK